MGKQVVVTIDLYDYAESHCMEHPKGESVTVPGEAMTVREIYDRYVRGQDMPDESVRRGMYYDDDQDFDSPDLEALARGLSVDNQEYLEQLRLDIEIKRKTLNDFLKKVSGEDPGTSQGSADTDAQKREGPSPDAGGKPTRKERRRKADDEEGDVSRASGGEFGRSSSARGDSKEGD